MLGLVRARQRTGFQMLLREAADGITKLLLFGSEFEVHCLGRVRRGGNAGVARLLQVARMSASDSVFRVPAMPRKAALHYAFVGERSPL